MQFTPDFIVNLIGLGLAVLIAAVGGVAYVNAAINKLRSEREQVAQVLRQEVEEAKKYASQRFHELSNRLMLYPNREEMVDHLNRIESSQRDTAGNVNALHRRVDELITLMANIRAGQTK